MEEKKEKKDKKAKVPFRIADKNPYIGVLLEMLWAAFWVMVVASLIGYIIGAIFEAIPGMPAVFNQTNVATLIGVITGLLVIRFSKKRMGASFDGYINNSNNILGCKLMIVWLLYWILGSIVVAIFSKLGLVTATTIIASLGAGVMEETVFRIVPLYYVMRHRENRKLVMYSVIITSVIFGIIHVSNVKSGAPLDISIFQAVASILMGLFFSACYLRTGNILFGIIPHFINDVVAGFDVGAMGENLIFTTGLQKQNFIDMAFIVIIGIFALYLIRPAKYDEIKELWDKKFAKN